MIERRSLVVGAMAIQTSEARSAPARKRRLGSRHGILIGVCILLAGALAVLDDRVYGKGGEGPYPPLRVVVLLAIVAFTIVSVANLVIVIVIVIVVIDIVS